MVLIADGDEHRPPAKHRELGRLVEIILEAFEGALKRAGSEAKKRLCGFWSGQRSCSTRSARCVPST